MILTALLDTQDVFCIDAWFSHSVLLEAGDDVPWPGVKRDGLPPASQTYAAGFQVVCPWPKSSTVELGGNFENVLGRHWIQLLCEETPLRRALQLPKGCGVLVLHPGYPTSQILGPDPMGPTCSLCKWCFSRNPLHPSRKKSRSGSPSDHPSWC